jgi:membrane-bound lytic murein transglycosylase B
MRIVLSFGLIALLAACASKPTAEAPSSPRQQRLAAQKQSDAAANSQFKGTMPVAAKASNNKQTTAIVQEAPPKQRVLPFNGRIASVNEHLRFVVIDFTNSARPQLDQRLSVYRVGQKVAEIRVSGPYRDTTVIADVVAGEVKYGDEVKPNNL